MVEKVKKSIAISALPKVTFHRKVSGNRKPKADLLQRYWYFCEGSLQSTRNIRSVSQCSEEIEFINEFFVTCDKKLVSSPCVSRGEMGEAKNRFAFSS